MFTIKKTSKRLACFCFSVWAQDQIQEDKEEQLNIILPGCLLPFHKEINSLFFAEKQKFLKIRDFTIFSKTSLKPDQWFLSILYSKDCSNQLWMKKQKKTGWKVPEWFWNHWKLKLVHFWFQWIKTILCCWI